MTFRFHPVFSRLGLGLGLTLLAAAAAAAAGPDIHQYASTNIKTLQMDGQVVTENRAELQKISGDFANAYRFHRVSMTYEQPGKLHFESVVAGVHIAYTINGNTRYTSVPTFHVHKVENISGAPGKKSTLLDEGLLPPEQLGDYNATFLRKEGGDPVYELTPKQPGETTKEIVWIDPATHITVKRQNFDRHGALAKWFLYKDPIQVSPGIYVPTRIEVYNAENKLAGITAYENIRINRPVNESVFNF
jgi:outer membrane lipoprotein-sorting protein